MSRYTTTVRYICESYASNTNSNLENVDSVIDSAIPAIFKNFPIFSENHRQELCEKILKHYYFREIAYETPAYWIFSINRKLNEIMPYFNQLYKTEAETFSPFLTGETEEIFTLLENENENESGNTSRNREHVTTFNGMELENSAIQTQSKNNSSFSNSSAEQEENRNAYSDTPEGTLSNVNDSRYLTDYRKINDNKSGSESGQNTNSGSGSSSTDNKKYFNNRHDDVKENENGKTENTKEKNHNQEYNKKTTNKGGGKSFNELLREFRENILNIDMLIIDELKTEFMQIW